MSFVRPVPAERIRRPLGVKESAAIGPVVGLAEVASGEWRVTSSLAAIRKKQIPRCARNDNSQEFRRTEVGVILAVRIWGRAGSDGRGCGCSCR